MDEYSAILKELDNLSPLNSGFESPPWQQMIENGAMDRRQYAELRSADQESGDMGIKELDINFSDGDDESDAEDNLLGGTGTPTLALREYQKELAEAALRGRNTIVCAPTGSGKTRVATHVILEHLKNRTDQRKVAFLAKTVPLALQQYKSLSKYLPSQYKITHITGQSKNTMSLHLILPEYDVVVMTPMILVNHLTRNLVPGLWMFSLLVFDECHHTKKEDPYNALMYSYLKTKCSNDRRRALLPQIVGLTASIGVDKAKILEKAVEHILSVCGNLDVHSISTVEKHRVELARVVPMPDEEMVKLENFEQNAFVREVVIIMDTLELYVGQYIRDLNNAELTKLLEELPMDKACQEYGHWTVRLKKAVKDVPIRDETQIAVRLPIIIADYLMAYSVALEIHILVELRDVIAYLDRCFALYRANEKRTTGEETFFSFFQDLRDKFLSEQQDPNPNLATLARTLKTHLIAKGPNSRGIIFVRTRALADAVAAWLNRCPHADLNQLNAAAFTGTNAPAAEGGMTPTTQEAVVERFRKGGVRLLVATSVAEEGLDIPECNLVIKYNHVGNEISTVQTKGRSRAFGGVSVLLAVEKILQRELVNQRRARLMDDAIRHIRAMRPEELRRNVLGHQQKVIEEGEAAEREEAEMRRRLKDVPFRVVCSLCRKIAVESTNIRTIYGKYRVSVDRRLLDHIKVVPRREQECIDEIQFVGTIICLGQPQPGKQCFNKLGVMLRHAGLPFVSLGIKNFGFDKGSPDKLTHHKQWKKVPYVINELNIDDIKRYIQRIPRR